MSLPSQLSLNPSFNVFISHLSDSGHRLLSKQRPWSELVDHNAFSRPTSFSETASRLQRNTTYFRINYAELLISVLAFSLITHPISLVCLGLLCFAWIVLFLLRPPEKHLVILSRSYSRNEVLGLLLLATAVVMLFTSIGSLLMHATLVGIAVVCVHGAFRCPEDLFTDDHVIQAVSYDINDSSIL